MSTSLNLPSADAAASRSSQAPTIAEATAFPVENVRPLVSVAATKLSHFVLLNPLGAGAMGSVYAAYDEKLDRRVALKLVHSPTDAHRQIRERTLREARAIARISHPNVISVFEVGESDQLVYIAMEYVDGETLLSWQERGGHSWQETLDMYLRAGSGLEAAHRASVVHRDFKPENVLLGHDGRVRVADFGIARLGMAPESSRSPAPTHPSGEGSESVPGSPPRLTQSGIISGTPGYMSPEQYRGGNVDSRSDQWSFCAVLFEALYGYLPFSGTTLKEHAESVLGPPRPPPSNTPVPEEIHQALLRGLSVDPSARFESMTQLLATLTLEQGDHAAARQGARKRFMSSLLGVALVVSAVQQLRQLHRPLIPRDMLGSGVVLLLAICAGGFLLRRQLISHPFHRTMWLMCLFIMLGNIGQRLLAVTLGMPIEWLFPFEMIFMTIMMAITAGFLFRSLRWAPLLPALAGILSLLNLVPIRTFTLIYPVIVGLAAIGWSRSARTATSTARAGDSSTDSVPLLALGRRRSSGNRSAAGLKKTRETGP